MASAVDKRLRFSNAWNGFRYTKQNGDFINEHKLIEQKKLNTTLVFLLSSAS